jgi:hypothetical protein
MLALIFFPFYSLLLLLLIAFLELTNVGLKLLDGLAKAQDVNGQQGMNVQKCACHFDNLLKHHMVWLHQGKCVRENKKSAEQNGENAISGIHAYCFSFLNAFSPKP